MKLLPLKRAYIAAIYSKLFWLLICASVTQSAQVAIGQEIGFARQDGPYYVGEPVLVQVGALGLAESDQIECKYLGDTTTGVSIEGPDPQRSSNRTLTIINGRQSLKQSIDYRFNFVITAAREGDFQIGPFEVTVNGEKMRVNGAAFRFGKLEPDPKMQVALELEKPEVYVGQKVPVTIRWTYTDRIQQVQYAFSNLQIRSPLFDQFDFIDPPPSRSRPSLTLSTAKGRIALPAEVEQSEKGNEQVVTVIGTRTLIPQESGTYDAISISCRTKRVIKWGRDLFGDLIARDAAPSLASGEPIRLVVKPIPTVDRPSSFSGAVGSAFSVEVAANRSVVRVGDPISLTIKIRGDGNLESLSLPKLTEQMGLSADEFQVPDEALPGTIDETGKQFKVNIRVKNQNVDQIPPLKFGWFDPDSEQFTVTESKPISLNVMETRVISASDVVSGSTSQPAKPATNLNTAPNESLSFLGANLAIETDPAKLLADSGSQGWMRYLPWTIYGVATLLGSWVIVRGRVPREVSQKRKLDRRFTELRNSIRSVRPSSGKQGLGTIASTLRDIIREFEPDNRSEFERLIQKCDNAIYAQSEPGADQLQQVIDECLSAIDVTSR